MFNRISLTPSLDRQFLKNTHGQKLSNSLHKLEDVIVVELVISPRNNCFLVSDPIVGNSSINLLWKMLHTKFVVINTLRIQAAAENGSTHFRSFMFSINAPLYGTLKNARCSAGRIDLNKVFVLWFSQNKRRDTWCPGALSRETLGEVLILMSSI